MICLINCIIAEIHGGETFGLHYSDIKHVQLFWVDAKASEMFDLALSFFSLLAFCNVSVMAFEWAVPVNVWSRPHCRLVARCTVFLCGPQKGWNCYPVTLRREPERRWARKRRKDTSKTSVVVWVETKGFLSWDSASSRKLSLFWRDLHLKRDLNSS